MKRGSQSEDLTEIFSFYHGIITSCKYNTVVAGSSQSTLILYSKNVAYRLLLLMDLTGSTSSGERKDASADPMKEKEMFSLEKCFKE